jgi:capsular polysaccharide transport system permease protein
LVVQSRVLLALMLREARTRYGRQRAGYLWALLQPLLHIGGFYLIYNYRMKFIPLGDSLVVFLASSFPLFFGFRDVMNRTQGAYSSNQSLLAYPVVNLMDVFLGRALLESATAMSVLILIFGGIVLLGYGDFPHSILKMVAAALCLYAIGFGAGLILGVVTEFLPSVGNLMAIPMRLLYFTSGLFYLPDSLPPGVRDILSWNPVLHGITLFREGYYNGYESQILDLQYLEGWVIGSLLLALVAERIARKPIRRIVF